MRHKLTILIVRWLRFKHIPQVKNAKFKIVQVHGLDLVYWEAKPGFLQLVVPQGHELCYILIAELHCTAL